MAGRLMAWAEGLPLPGRSRLGAVGPRTRRVGLVVVSSLAGRFVGLVVQVVQVPLVVAAVGANLYGEAAAILAFVGLLAGFDLGLGSAVKNTAADLVGRNHASALPMLVGKATAWSGLVACFVGWILLAFPLLLRPLPGSDSILPLLEVDAATQRLVVMLISLAIPLTTAIHCVEGMQLTWLVDACRMAAATVGLAATVAVVSLVSQRWQVVALLGSIPLVAGIATCVVLWRHLPQGRGRHDVGMSLSRLVCDGFPFVLPIVASLLVTHAPQLAILSANGSPAVTRYMVGQRLMAIGIQPMMFMVGPLWPAFAEARATGEREWVVRQVRRASWAAVAYAATVTIVGAGCGRWVAAAWVGRPEAVPSTIEMAAIAAAAGSVAVVQPGAMLLNAFRRFRLATAVAAVQIVVALAYEPLARLGGPAAVPAAQAIFGWVVVVPAVIAESRAALRQ